MSVSLTTNKIFLLGRAEGLTARVLSRSTSPRIAEPGGLRGVDEDRAYNLVLEKGGDAIDYRDTTEAYMNLQHRGTMGQRVHPPDGRRLNH
jgi:hypothetical protein